MSDDDFDAGAAVARALGEEPAQTANDGPEPGGPDPSDTGRDGSDGTVDDSPQSPLAKLRERVLATEPDVPLSSDSLDSWDVEDGGLRRVKRGLWKFTGVDGATALEDIFIGAAELFYGEDIDFGSNDDGPRPSDAVDDDGGALIA